MSTYTPFPPRSGPLQRRSHDAGKRPASRSDYRGAALFNRPATHRTFRPAFTCSSLLQRSLKGGLIAIGALNLGGTVDQVHNPVAVAELAIEKGAVTLLMPVSARRRLMDLSDDMATKVDIQFYSDAREALVKALLD